MLESRSKHLDYLFTDLHGLLRHISRCVGGLDAKEFAQPLNISGSLIPGWQSISESDLLLVPDIDCCALDPFSEGNRALVFCDVVDPYHVGEYSKDARTVAKRAVNAMQAMGIADSAQIGAELEFMVFEGVRFATSASENYVFIKESDGYANNAQFFTDGHRIGGPSMQLATAPADRFVHLREEICTALKQVGLKPLRHMHEEGPSQQEITVDHLDLLRAADAVQLQKYVIKNVAQRHGLSATFMPKPMPSVTGNGLHINLSLWKKDRNLFYGDSANCLSPVAEFFIGGVLRHLKSLNAILNPTTNSYRRLAYRYSLVHDAGYGYRNRSMPIRIPHFSDMDECRVEIRFSDPSANPYLAFSAVLMAGLEGIKNRITPPEPSSEALLWFERPIDVRRLSKATVARDLIDAMQSLFEDHAYLTDANVFDEELIQSLIVSGNHLIQMEADVPSPIEFAHCFGTS